MPSEKRNPALAAPGFAIDRAVKADRSEIAEPNAVGCNRTVATTQSKSLKSRGEVVAPTASWSSFDYSTLDIDKQVALRKSAADVRKHRADVAKGIFKKMGGPSSLQGIELPHGQFGPWLEAEFDWTDRTARNYMMVAERLEGKTEIVSDLQPSTIYLLASPSTPETIRDEVVRRKAAGEHLADHVVKSLVVEAKRTRQPRPTSPARSKQASDARQSPRGG